MHLKDWVLHIKKTYFHPKADEILRKEFQEKIEEYQKEYKKDLKLKFTVNYQYTLPNKEKR